MLTISRKLLPALGILLVLLLAACGSDSNLQQADQPHQTAATTPAITSTSARTSSATTAAPVRVQGHTATPPRRTPVAVATGRSTKPTAPAPTATNMSGGASQGQLAQYVLGLINHDRASMGLAPYRWSGALAVGAHQHNLRMVAYGQLSHQCPGEADLGTRISNDGLAWRAAGENIGWSDYPEPQQGVLANHLTITHIFR
jgi:uncharacterized protein YkwD